MRLTTHCHRCGILKTLENSYVRKHRNNGLQCKKCAIEINCTAKIRRRKNNPAALGVSNLRAHLKREFGLSLEQYYQMHKDQCGRCYICEKSIPRDYILNGNSGESGRGHVDHDHTTGAVRGLLCSKCNRGLGFFLDNPRFLEKAARYIILSGEGEL